MLPDLGSRKARLLVQDRGRSLAEALVAEFLLIVSRTAQRYSYLEHVFADESRDVILDRREGSERRQRRRPATDERRHVQRRQHDITRELRSPGWALVRRSMM